MFHGKKRNGAPRVDAHAAAQRRAARSGNPGKDKGRRGKTESVPRRPQALQRETEVIRMPKDSQPDGKKARVRKSRGQTPPTRENQNQSNNAKKQSAGRGDV